MGFQDVTIRCYDEEIDRVRVEFLERKCEVGPSERVFLFTDTLGDPICRIRNSPMYKMLVAERMNELVGVIQGSIKVVTIHKPPKNLAKVGYILGLRVAPLHRREGIGSTLVRNLQEWFVENDADYAYMATEKNNEASVKLFIDKLGFVKFRTPAILVNPVNHGLLVRISSGIEIKKIKTDEAEYLYRKFMYSTELFSHDIDNILRNELNLGTWVAYPSGESWCTYASEFPTSWAMVSVWNSGGLFKLRLGKKVPLSWWVYSKSSRLIDRVLPCLKLPTIPDFFHPFGFYFIYGIYLEGPFSSKMLKNLCKFVHNMGTKCGDCKVIVTEVEGKDDLRLDNIPHQKMISCQEDLWCIKALKNEESISVEELTKTTKINAIFVDPREV